MVAGQNSASTTEKISLGLGLALAIVGLLEATGLVDILTASDVLLSHGLPPGTILFSCAAMLALTWWLWGAPLAVVGLAALLHAATWHHDLAMPDMASLDVVGTAETALLLGLDIGTLGWVLETMLSKALPLFLLGSVLASRVVPPVATSKIGNSVVTALSAGCRSLLPTLVLGMVFMAERPGGAVPFIDGISPLPFDLSLEQSAVMAIAVVIALGATAADVRRRPWLALRPLAQGGVAFGRLLIAAGVIGIVLAVLARSGLPLDIARILAAVSGEAKLPLLLSTAIVTIGASMFMPGLAAYLIVAALLGPSLRTVGVADITSHLIILFISVAASGWAAARAAPGGSWSLWNHTEKRCRSPSNEAGRPRQA